MLTQSKAIHYIPATAQTATLLRVAAYCRVSSDSTDQLESYAAQLDHYGKLVGQNPNWEMVDLYADEGLTGTRADKRLDFQLMLNDCRAGKIDKILVKSISRFARNTSDCLTAIRELSSLGVVVFFEKERIDTGDMGGELILSFYGAAAQEESFSISGNMRWSYKRRMKRGEFITCKAPYGYRLLKNTLIIKENEASIVRRIFHEFLSGSTMTDIAERLALNGVEKNEGSWSTRAIEFILKNEKYAGNVLLQKRYKTENLPFSTVWNKGEQTMYYIENSNPAIIDMEAFERAQELMQRKFSRSSPQKYPFSQKIYCGVCGSSFKRRICNKKTYWVCCKHNKNKDDCPTKQMPELSLEQSFIHMYRKLSINRREILAPMLEQLTTLNQRTAFQQSRITEIDNEILETGRQSIMLHRLYGARRMDTAHYYAQTQALNKHVNVLRLERQRLIENVNDSDVIERTIQMIDILKEYPDKFESFDSELFHSMVRRVTIFESKHARFELINGLEVTEAL